MIISTVPAFVVALIPAVGALAWVYYDNVEPAREIQRLQSSLGVRESGLAAYTAWVTSCYSVHCILPLHSFVGHGVRVACLLSSYTLSQAKVVETACEVSEGSCIIRLHNAQSMFMGKVYQR
jgi:hypothetical protein